MNSDDAIARFAEGDRLLFHCPGCKCAHAVFIAGTGHPVWKWNGDQMRPTLSPSINVTWNEGDKPMVCHSFVVDGAIQFLSDCTHELAGRTVPLTPL